MKTPNPRYKAWSSPAGHAALWRTPLLVKSVLYGLIVLAGSLIAPPALAQSVSIRSQPQRITIADAATGSYTLTNYASISGVATPVNLTLYGLPGAANYSYSVGSGSASFGTLLTVNYATVPDAIYPLDVNGSGGAAGDLYLTLQSGRMWTGTTNVSTAWSSSASWVGGVPPGAANDVLFTQIGGQTNLTNSAGVFFPNSVVDQNFTVASLRFSQTNSGTPDHIININPNITLAVTGSNGLSMLQDYTATGSGMSALFSGTNGTLEVSNSIANITMLEDDSTTHTLDLSRLGTFVADVNRVAPGDYLLYPNLTNQLAEGYSGSTVPFIYANKFYPKFYLARTNFVTALYKDPNNYTNGSYRSYGFEMVNNPVSATSSSAFPTLSLGVTNVINSDGICFSGFGGTTASVNFNPSLLVNTNITGGTTNYTTNSMVAIFRNTDGISRISAFTIGDLAGSYTNANGNTKCNVSFGTNNSGYVDILVDRFYMSRDRGQVFNSSGDDAQTTFSIGAGILNANTVYIGDQENGNQPFMNYVYGTMNISNKAVLQINGSLQLGYETASYNDTSLPGDTYGILNVGPGGTVIASAIGVGGVTKNSGKVGSSAGGLNSIILTNGATLIVSNTIADASAINQSSVTANVTPGMLGTFNMYNSELVLNVNGTNTGAYVFTSAFNYTGSSSNYLVINSIKNLTVPAVGSTNIPLIWIQSASPNAAGYAAAFSKVIVPSGYQGALVLDATNSQILDLNLSAHAPRNLEWKGYLSGNWDTTTQNWLDLTTGLHTNFDNGDFTTFDDTSSITNINLTSAVTLIPNNITVTNNTDYYTFGSSSGGTLVGGGVITKAGTGVLEIDAQITLGVQINQGAVVGSGSIGGVAVVTGAALDYSGTVNGNIACSGLGLNYGTINGPITVGTGGVFTNYNSLNAIFTVQNGGTLYNAGTIAYASGTSAVGTNSTVVNGGTLNCDVIDVNAGGTFEDLGGATADTLTSITVNPGGTFIPGGSGIGTTTINSDGVGSFPGAVLLTQGSTIVFNLNFANPQTNTVLVADHLTFGASASAQTQNGATIQINNLGTAHFSAGQYFQLFNNVYSSGSAPYNTGTSTNTFPVISPASPGPGLTWDLSQLWLYGVIGVIPANSGPALTSSFAGDGTGTNIVGQFSWSASYLGYRLETEVTPLTVGLTATNWTGIPGSTTNTSMIITNVLNPTNCVFYRMVYP